MRSTAGPVGETERGHAIPAPQVKPPRRRTRLSASKKALFTFGTTILLIALPEAFCRLVGLGKLQPVAPHVSDWHRTLDGRSFWVLRGSGRNSDGLRDREHAVDKPPGVFRIVFLGDSVTEGFGPQDSRVYSRHFEALLRQAGLPVEVFNIAVAGWSTLQEATAYRVIARKYRPDQVFLEFCLNDVAEMHNNLAQPPPVAVGMLLRHSALFRWLVNAEGRQVRSVRELFDHPEAAAVRSGWRRVFDELLVLQRETRADGCDLSVVVFPFRFQLDPGAPPPIAQRTLFEFCRSHDIPCLDLLPALEKVGSDAFVDESHLSTVGAEAVAQELVRWGRSGCILCGYDLTGIKSDRCPRCGNAITR